MARIEESIDVEVPVETAYNQWTQFEEFPTFMEGIEQVRQIDDTHLHWTAEVGGKREEWDAEITEQHPDHRVAWNATSGKGNAGVVTFHRIDDAQTRVMVQMDWEPEGVTEKIGTALGMDDRRVQGDLKRFKELIEQRGSESAPGAARSRIRATERDLRAAFAGATAAAAWPAAEPALRRIFRTPYSDVRLLGRRSHAPLAAGRGRRCTWRTAPPPAIVFGGAGCAAGRPAVAAAQLEGAAIWPGMAVADRVHPDRRSGAWPPLLRNPAVFAQEVAAHALFGLVLGLLLRDE